jgi:glycosyltransferase involved in cell wall biosynthesis
MTNSDKSITVLHVVGVMGGGGVETWLMRVLRRINRQRFHFTFYCYGKEPGTYAPEITSLGATIYASPRILRPLTFPKHFRRVLREGRYDIVHCHDLCISGYIVRSAARENVGVRIAHLHIRSEEESLQRKLFRKLTKGWTRRYATNILSCSRDSAVAVFGADWEKDSRIRVLHCGIDVEPFKQAMDRIEIRRELGIPPDVYVVGHVGNFAKRKNHPFIIDIASHVLSSEPNTYFLLVGDGSLRPYIENLARKKNISNRVIFAGSRPDVPRLLVGAMDVFVFPSLTEGLPMVVLEAQAAGLPCLISDRVTSEGIVIPELCKVMPLETGARAWGEQLISSLKLPRPQAAQCLETVCRSTFTADKSAEALQQFYLDALSKPSE